MDRVLLPKKPGITDDINAIRKEVTDLMQILHGEDAQAIPWDTRMKWVDKVCERVSSTSLESLPGCGAFSFF